MIIKDVYPHIYQKGLLIAQVKVLRDTTKKDKSGKPQCKGIAFAEFKDHEHALCALRQLNNNPAPFGADLPPRLNVSGRSIKDSHVPESFAIESKEACLQFSRFI